MKVVLALPPISSPIKANFVDTFDNESGQYPPIGLLYLAAYLKANSSHEVTILDCQAENLSHKNAASRLKILQPDVLGIHCLTFHYLDCLKLAENAKIAWPDVTVVVGGPHVHIFPEETLLQSPIDYSMVGEAEVTFSKFVEYVNGSIPRDHVEGLYFLNRAGEPELTKPNPLLPDLDLMPNPARELTNVSLYNSVLAKRSSATTLMTSRGCPFTCIYCDRPALGKTFRARSSKNVVDEIEECIQLGITEFNIFDDTFTIDRKRVVKICEEIIARGLNIRWSCRSRVHLVSPEILTWMKRAGCGRISFGVETADDRVGKILQKGADVAQAEKAIAMTKEAGIEVLADFIIGSPGETKTEIDSTIEFALRTNPTFAQFSIMTPYPATKLYQMGLNEYKLYDHDHWREFATNPSPDWETPIWNQHFSKEELVSMCEEAYNRFYIRPTFIARQLKELQSFGEFVRKARAGLKILSLRLN